MSSSSSTPDSPSSSPTPPKKIRMTDAYEALAINCAVKGLTGLVVAGLPALVLGKGTSMRLIAASLGTGVGLGWAMHETDMWLRKPTAEKGGRESLPAEARWELGVSNKIDGMTDWIKDSWRKK
eukprot:GHVQ01024809.1.p1 GENE.GHVQ01024809.1~~GHVQ01024809.1.p1  ORF type:complete len:124 (+),score=28.37 GHVQ01024809.1:589-960(+)